MLIIGICGASGSGKSTLAHALQDRLGKDRCLILQQDAYYYDHPDLSFEELRTNYSGRITSRLMGSDYQILTFCGADYRIFHR